MRKLLLIAMLALSTLAWAHGAKKTDHQSSRAGNDWYQAMLNTQIDQSVRLNKTTGPPAIAFSENAPAQFQTPSAMAARQGGKGEDFYNQRVKIASEVHQRDLDAKKSKR